MTAPVEPIARCPEELAALKTAWNRGDTAKQIVCMFKVDYGRTLTTSAVQGLVYRNRKKLGLDERAGYPREIDPESKPRPRKPVARTTVRVAQPPPPVQPLPAPVIVHAAPPIPFAEISDRRCKWAVTDRLPHMFCGASFAEGSAYCDGHRTISINPNSAARRRRPPVSMRVAMS